MAYDIQMSQFFILLNLFDSRAEFVWQSTALLSSSLILYLIDTQTSQFPILPNIFGLSAASIWQNMGLIALVTYHVL
jgi:hypothetical protein